MRWNSGGSAHRVKCDPRRLEYKVEIKSSVSKGHVVIFERKVRYFEERHQLKADRLAVSTPMLDPRARSMVEELGIQVYTSAYVFGEE